ncbi:MAG: APC family permease [Oscillospiraceae bacterium]|nr:APC family permease [Oscillospiraceae bacterium]
MRKRLSTFLFGKPLKDSDLKHEKLNVLWGVSTFSSDTISTVSYAGEEILLVLIPVLGTAAYGVFVPVIAALIVLLALLVIGYRQMIDVYPRGGGAYTVAMENLGKLPGLIAGSSLIFEYVMAVAVSVSAAAAAITSAIPAAEPYKSWIAILLIALLSWGHLRGTRESSVIFGIPTYLFVLTMLILIGVGFVRWVTGGYVPLQVPAVPDSRREAMTVVLFRAFASGCTAIAGVESVSNGVSSFREPAQKTAKNVLLTMAVIVSVIFLGTGILISLYHITPSPYETMISQLARTVFGIGSPMYYVAQVMTVLILILAANTAFADLPHLMAMMAHDGYLPSRFITRGTRLNYTNGILFMFLSASLLVFSFHANQHELLPLFASVIFISFFLHQLGMLRYWWRARAHLWQPKALLCCVTLAVISITLVTLLWSSFLAGSWVVLLGISVLTVLMTVIARHYDHVHRELVLRSDAEVRAMLSSTHSGKAILPMRSINRAFIKAYNCAKDMGFTQIELFYIGSSEAEAAAIRDQLRRSGITEQFVSVITEYRDTEDILIHHIEAEERKLARHEHLTVLIPNLVTMNPIKQYLHNETSRILLSRMARHRYVYVFQVPYLFR